jgi:3-hydroxyisobutyrate dehydrogenase
MSFPQIVPPMRIAFIGLGNMGLPMGACLARAGFTICGFDISLEARARFASETGAQVVESSIACVKGSAAIVTMLPNGKIVGDLIAQAMPHLSPGALVVDMSSSEPMGTRELGQKLKNAGIDFVDAPVSGGVRRAVDGSLSIMAGGEPGSIDRAETLLKAMGRTIFRTGPVGSGHAMKALNNYVSGAGLIAACEAINIGQAFGLEPSLMVDVLNASTGRNNSTEVKLKQFILSQTWGSGFSTGLMAKDIRSAMDLAETLGIDAQLADRCADLWDDAATKIGGSADHTEIQRYLQLDK